MSALTLRNFDRLIGQCIPKRITQTITDNFILQRGNKVKRPTYAVFHKQLQNHPLRYIESSYKSLLRVSTELEAVEFSCHAPYVNTNFEA